MSTDIAVISPENETVNDFKKSITKSFDIDVFLESYSNDLNTLSKQHENVADIYKNLDDLSHLLLVNHENNFFPQIDNMVKIELKLRAKYWKRVFEDLNFFILMSANEKSKWLGSIEKYEVPEFKRENVISVILDIINSSPRFFAERMIFALKGLSKTHLTNSQFGFAGKMIFDEIHTGFTGKSYNNASICTSDLDNNIHVTEHLDEIRKIVAYICDGNLDSLTKKDFTSSYDLINIALKSIVLNKKNEFLIDFGRIHIKVFKVGTVHLHIDPEIALKMNDFLACVMPNKIPQKLNKKNYSYNFKKDLVKPRYIQNNIINLFDNLRQSDVVKKHFKEIFSNNKNVYTLNKIEEKFDISILKNKDFLDVLDSFCGELHILENNNKNIYAFSFPFSIEELLSNLKINNFIDDKITYQQFYTSENLSRIAYEKLIEDEDDSKIKTGQYLEPSSGKASLLKFLPKKNTLAVDISLTNSIIAKKLGYKSKCIDFVDFKKKTYERFDYILMNPPFTLSQAFSHTMACYELLNDNGKLVSILPSSLRESFEMLNDGKHNIEISKDFEKEFEGTNVTVFILTIKKL